MTVIVTGPAGAGKTTIGRALADDLGWPFLEADDLHAPDAIEQMHHGRGLTDADRAPWLRRVHDAILDALHTFPHLVVACSALKQRYRDQLSTAVPDLRWVYLDADEALLRRRLAARAGHFAGVELLASQLADLEPPDQALVVPADVAVGEAVTRIRSSIGQAPRHE